ncbi:MAG: YfgM family protein [Granulosicoccus sp.]
MEYETEEQQVEALKAWWAENGRAVIAGVVLGGGVIGGWTFWQDRAERKTVAASDNYSLALEAVNEADTDTALNLADQVQSDNPGHLYAAYASFAAARAAVESDDLAEAVKRLQWVVDNAPQDDVKLIAQVRLARVKGANGDPSAGLSVLPGSFPESFTGLVEEARGDLHVLAGDEDAAKTAYEAASASEYVANREGLTMKINELAKPGDMESSGSESTS